MKTFDEAVAILTGDTQGISSAMTRYSHIQKASQESDAVKQLHGQSVADMMQGKSAIATLHGEFMMGLLVGLLMNESESDAETAYREANPCTCSTGECDQHPSSQYRS